MKQLLLIVLLLMAATFAKSSRTTSGGMRSSGGWAAPAKRPGASGSPARYTPPPSAQAPKINTSMLSNQNRSLAPVKPVSAPAPAPVKVVTAVPGKINTSSLSDPNRPKVVVAPPAPVAPKPVAPTVVVAQAKAPAAVQTQVKNVTVVRHTYVNHRYDNGYRFTPAPVIIVAGAPTYHYNNHDYPIVMRNGAYYADVDGRQMEFAQADGGWGQVAPEPTPAPVQVAAPAQPAPKVQAPPKTLEVKDSFSDRHPIIYTLLILMAIGLVAIAGYVVFKLVRGDTGK